MAKNAYMIVSDLHLYFKNISSRVDYVEEMKQVRMKMIDTASKYLKAGYDKVILLLLGDVFHRGYNKVEQAVYDSNFFTLWREKIGECYSVIGNHELTYSKENPFFSLVSSIESDKIKKITNRVWTPKGLLPIINVVDVLQDGEVTFYFNHYNCPISLPDSKISIGLFHQDIVCSEIVASAKQQLGSEVFAETIDFDNAEFFNGYDYCFFGHMHKIYGTWELGNGTTLCYLASLGRTNVGEVNDNFLERSLPVVKVIDGQFQGIDDNKITLAGFSECVNEQIVKEKSEQYELTKAKKQARKYAPLDDNPLDSLFAYYLEDPYSTKVIKELLSNPVDSIGQVLEHDYAMKFGG